MIINKKCFKISFAEPVLLLAAVLYAVGIRYWFPVCMSMEKVMSCHWAGEVLKAMSVLMIGLALISIFLPDAWGKIGVNISAAGISVLMMLIPGRVISICSNEAMKCRQGTSVGTLIFTLIFILIAIVDMVICASMLASEKHKRK